MAYVPKQKLEITPKLKNAGDDRVAFGDTFLYRDGDTTGGNYIFTGNVYINNTTGNSLSYITGVFSGLTGASIYTNYITGDTGVICQFTACTVTADEMYAGLADIQNIYSNSIVTDTLQSNYLYSVSGDMQSLHVTTFSADTYFSGSTPLQFIIDGSKTKIRNGINTFTGGTEGDYTVNITAATLSNLTVTGNTSLNSVSATTYFSGSTPMDQIFVTPPQLFWTGGTAGLDSIKRITGLNFSTSANTLVMQGVDNRASNSYSTILNGRANRANGKYSAIINGKSNQANGIYSVVFGAYNIANGATSNIFGGSNVANGVLATIFGKNSLGNGNYSLCVGSQNTAQTTSSVCIGYTNFSSGFVGGGLGNRSYSRETFIGQGLNNRAGNISLGAYSATILNGRNNSANGYHSSILAGRGNNITSASIHGSIINGSGNTINGGIYNTIINGTGLTLSDDFTVLVPQLQIASVSSGGTLNLTYDPITRKVMYGTLFSASTTTSNSINNGLNTYTGGTSTFQSVNISGLTINNINVSGSSVFNTLSAVTLSASTIISGSTNLYGIFQPIGNYVTTSQLSSNINGINTFTAGTANAQSINVTGLTIDNLRVTGATTLGSVTATTYYSGTSELSTLFVTTGNTPYEVSYFRKRGANLTRWYTGGVNAVANATVSLAKDITRYVPFIVPATQTISLIACEVTTFGTAGAVARLGIYDSITNTASAFHLQPQNVVADCGTVAIDSNGVKSITGLTVTLTPGLYFLALNHNSTAATTFRSLGAAACPVIFALSAGMGGANATHLTESVTFAAFTTANTSLAAALTLPPIVAVQLA